jgi:hypothetical protein
MKRKRTRPNVLTAVLAGVVIAAIGASIARADFKPGQYTHNSCAGTYYSRVDPSTSSTGTGARRRDR